MLSKAVLTSVLVALTACQESAPSTTLATPPAPQSATNERRTEYVIDTAAILTNRRLDQLLLEAQRASLVEYRSAKALPPAIVAFLEKAQGEKMPIADTGAAYEATDVISGELPRRQLTYLGIGSNMVLLAYNLGGFGVSERVLMFQLKDQEITDFWTGYVQGKPNGRAGILDYLRKHKDEQWAVNTNIIYF